MDVVILRQLVDLPPGALAAGGLSAAYVRCTPSANGWSGCVATTCGDPSPLSLPGSGPLIPSSRQEAVGHPSAPADVLSGKVTMRHLLQLGLIQKLFGLGVLLLPLDQAPDFLGLHPAVLLTPATVLAWVINCSAVLSLLMVCSAVCPVRFMVESLAQSDRMRTLVQPGSVSCIYVI